MHRSRTRTYTDSRGVADTAGYWLDYIRFYRSTEQGPARMIQDDRCHLNRLSHVYNCDDCLYKGNRTFIELA